MHIKYYAKHGDIIRAKAREKAKQLRAAGLLNLEKRRISNKRWEENNKEKALASRRRWNKKSKEYFREYATQNRDAVNAAKRKWELANPEAVKASKRVSQKLRKRRMVGKITPEQWRQILDFYNHRCGQCGKNESEERLTLDHYVPISKRGSNFWDNVWPLCLTCNIHKNDKMPDAPHPPHADKFILNGDNKLVRIPAFSFRGIADTEPPSPLIARIYGQRRAA